MQLQPLLVLVALVQQLLVLTATAELGVSDSDVAQQLFRRSARGDAAARLSARVALPAAVTARLLRLNLQPPATAFAQLPGLLQRALLWDAGFVLFDGRALVQVWTAGGRSMADVLVTADEWAATDGGGDGGVCATRDCAAGSRAFACACDARVALLAKCAVADTYAVFDDALPAGAPVAVWGTGATDPNAVPEPTLVEHNCWTTATNATDGSSTRANISADLSQEDRIIRSTSLAAVYSIYSSPVANSSETECSATRYDAFVIPCARIATMNNSARTNWREPKASTWLDEWLVEAASSLAAQDSDTNGGYRNGSSPPASSPSSSASSSSSSASPSSFNMVLLIPIVLGSLFVLAVVGLLLLQRNNLRREDFVRAATAGSSLDANAFLTPVTKSYNR